MEDLIHEWKSWMDVLNAKVIPPVIHKQFKTSLGVKCYLVPWYTKIACCIGNELYYIQKLSSSEAYLYKDKQRCFINMGEYSPILLEYLKHPYTQE